MTEAPISLQTYIDLWVVRNGEGWAPISEEMLIDGDGLFGDMMRALSHANLLDVHYLENEMVYKAKLKKGVWR